MNYRWLTEVLYQSSSSCSSKHTDTMALDSARRLYRLPLTVAVNVDVEVEVDVDMVVVGAGSMTNRKTKTK